MAALISAGRLQLLGLAASAALGLIPGALFAVGSPAAWQGTYATFLWSLIAGFAVLLIASARGQVPEGAWRQGLALSLAVFFSQTTLYLAPLLLLSSLAPAQALPAPALVALAPICYGSSAAMTLFSGPLFFRWLPRRRR
jgi:hypothetical protein